MYAGTDNIQGSTVAIQIIPTEDRKTRPMSIENQLSICRRLNGKKGFVDFKEHYEDDEKNFYMVFEYATYGNLEVMTEPNGWSEKHAKRLFSPLFASVREMHQMNIIHRDIKCSTILLFKEGNDVLAKLGHFQLAREMTFGQRFVSGGCGSPLYSPPEMTKNEPYDGYKADVWALGVSLYCAVFSCYPFLPRVKGDLTTTVRDLFLQIRTSPLVLDTKLISPQLRDLLCRLLEKDPNKRISLEEVLRHNWFQNRPSSPSFTRVTSVPLSLSHHCPTTEMSVVF